MDDKLGLRNEKDKSEKSLSTGKLVSKVEKILKGSLDLIPSPSSSVKIQIMGGKVCLMCKGKTLLLLKTKILLTSPSNVLPYYPSIFSRLKFEFLLKVKVMGSNPDHLLKSFLL